MQKITAERSGRMAHNGAVDWYKRHDSAGENAWVDELQVLSIDKITHSPPDVPEKRSCVGCESRRETRYAIGKAHQQLTDRGRQIRLSLSTDIRLGASGGGPLGDRAGSDRQFSTWSL